MIPRSGHRFSDKIMRPRKDCMTFVLAHLSDPHLAPLPQPRLAELIGKRATGFVNWRRKREAIHRPEVLARIVADLKAQSAGSHRGHRRSRQSGAAGRIRAGARLARCAGLAGRRDVGAGQSRRLCAQRRCGVAARTGATSCAATQRRRHRRLPVPAAARAAGADRGFDVGAEPAADGDRPRRRRSTAAARNDAG